MSCPSYKCNKVGTCPYAQGGGCDKVSNYPNKMNRSISQAAFFRPELDNGMNCQCGGSGCPCVLDHKIMNNSGAMKAVSMMEPFNTESMEYSYDPYKPQYYYSKMSESGENLPWRISNPLAFYNKFATQECSNGGKGCGCGNNTACNCGKSCGCN